MTDSSVHRVASRWLAASVDTPHIIESVREGDTRALQSLADRYLEMSWEDRDIGKWMENLDPNSFRTIMNALKSHPTALLIDMILRLLSTHPPKGKKKSLAMAAIGAMNNIRYPARLDMLSKGYKIHSPAVTMAILYSLEKEANYPLLSFVSVALQRGMVPKKTRGEYLKRMIKAVQRDENIAAFMERKYPHLLPSMDELWIADTGRAEIVKGFKEATRKLLDGPYSGFTINDFATSSKNDMPTLDLVRGGISDGTFAEATFDYEIPAEAVWGPEEVEDEDQMETGDLTITLSFYPDVGTPGYLVVNLDGDDYVMDHVSEAIHRQPSRIGSDELREEATPKGLNDLLSQLSTVCTDLGNSIITIY